MKAKTVFERTDGRTDAHTVTRMDKPKKYAPHFFKVGGIISFSFIQLWALWYTRGIN